MDLSDICYCILIIKQSVPEFSLMDSIGAGYLGIWHSRSYMRHFSVSSAIGSTIEVLLVEIGFSLFSMIIFGWTFDFQFGELIIAANDAIVEKVDVIIALDLFVSHQMNLFD